jgi:hypothetical protein
MTSKLWYFLFLLLLNYFCGSLICIFVHFSVGALKVKNTCIQFREFCQQKSKDGLVPSFLYVHVLLFFVIVLLIFRSSWILMLLLWKQNLVAMSIFFCIVISCVFHSWVANEYCLDESLNYILARCLKTLETVRINFYELRGKFQTMLQVLPFVIKFFWKYLFLSIELD